MSDMRHLLETVTKFAGEPEQKPGDQVRGGEPMPRRGTKKHPHAGRLVGGESILRELEQQIVEGQVERRLREEFSSTVKSAADKIVSAGSATRDALGSALDAIPSIPRPFDEKEVAKGLQVPTTQPKTSWRNTDIKKVNEFASNDGDDREPDEEEILRQLAAQWWNGTEQQMAKAQKTLAAMGWEIGQDESGDDDAGVFLIRPGDVDGDTYIAFPHSELGLQEWGAAGTAVGPGNDDADPVEIAAQRAQQVAGKTEQHNQLAGLISQVNSARSQLADLNKQFPQGANPVEKAMSMQQQQAQRVQLGRQIEDLMTQVAGIRSQA